MQDKSWIKLYRKMIDWVWFSDSNTVHVFLYLLLSACVEERCYKGVQLNRGEVATTYPTISTVTKLSIRQSRTAVEHLKMTGEVTVTQYPKFSVFTIVNYDSYQSTPTGNLTGNRQANDSQLDSQVTVNPSPNRQAAYNIKEYKNKNKEKELYINTAVADFSDDEELKKLVLDFYDSRKKMKKPMTDRAVDMLLKKLREYSVAEQKDMLQNAIMNGWLSVYPAKQQSKQQKKQESVYSSDASYDLSTFAQDFVGSQSWLEKHKNDPWMQGVKNDT